MTFSNLCNDIFGKSTSDYHITDSVDAPMNNPYELKTIEYYLYLKNWIDAVQWHFEDIIPKCFIALLMPSSSMGAVT